MSERSFSQDHPLVVAHRGASRVAPENTIPAFDAAVEAGADAVELDVRLSADGVPVVLHDARVDRTTGGTGLARDLTADAIARLDVSMPGGGVTHVPTLAEVLEALSGRVGVDVELKQLPGEPDFDPEVDRLVEATLAAIDATGFDGPVLLSSFNPLSIAAARRLAPGVPTGLLSLPEVEADVALGFAQGEGHDWLLPGVRAVLEAGAGFPRRVHEAGLRLATWNSDDPAEARTLMDWGVDAVATNDPAAIVAARAGADR